MFCRLFTHGKTVISYKSTVKDLYFIRQGIVEVFNNENDECIKDLAVLYLPTYSYFGDYQILKSLKSNVTIKTLSLKKQFGDKVDEQSVVPQENIFMCIEKTQFLELCDLFPQTKENLIRKSLERREKFIKQRNLNSKEYWRLRGSSQYNKGKPQHMIFDGNKDSYGRPMETLDKIVHDQIMAEEKTMNDFTSDYPYNKDVKKDLEY